MTILRILSTNCQIMFLSCWHEPYTYMYVPHTLQTNVLGECVWRMWCVFVSVWKQTTGKEPGEREAERRVRSCLPGFFFFLLPRVEKMLQMCNFGQNTAVVTVTFYPAIQSQWWRGETNSTRTNPHILHVQVLNINNNGEERNTADLWLSMFITDDTPRLPQYQYEKQRLEEHFVCRRSIR